MSFDTIDNLIDSAMNQGETHSLQFLFELKIEELGITETAAREMMGIESRTMKGILNGTLKQIDFLNLIKLAELLGIPNEKCLGLFMASLTETYKTDVDDVKRKKYLLENFDLENLKKSKFIQTIRNYEQIEKRIVEFFELSNIYEYNKVSITTAFSQTKRGRSSKMVNFWVDAAFKEAVKVNNPYQYNREKLVGLLPKFRIKSLKDAEGLKELAKELFSLGITAIFQPSMSALQINGASFAVKNKPCIVISDFNKNYPLIWIAIIHELHHILFDWEDVLINKAIVSDEEDNSEIEVEARNFSHEYFLPAGLQEILKTNATDIFLMKKLAIRFGVHESIFLTVYGIVNEIKEATYWAMVRKVSPMFNFISTAVFLNDWERVKSVSESTKKIKELIISKV